MEDGTSRDFVERLQKDMKEIMDKHEGCDAQIASGGGRMAVTMDRYEVRVMTRKILLLIEQHTA